MTSFGDAKVYFQLAAAYYQDPLSHIRVSLSASPQIISPLSKDCLYSVITTEEKKVWRQEKEATRIWRPFHHHQDKCRFISVKRASSYSKDSFRIWIKLAYYAWQGLVISLAPYNKPRVEIYITVEDTGLQEAFSYRTSHWFSPTRNNIKAAGSGWN